MPRSRVGWRPSARHTPEVAPHPTAAFPTRTQRIGRAHPIRDVLGRFAYGTQRQRYAADIGEARAGYHRQAISGGQQFGVFEGRLTGREVAIRKGAAVALDEREVRAVIQGMSESARRLLYRRLIATSPVDTGLLRSQWRLTEGGVANRVPYVWQTEVRNRSSRGYIRRAIRLTLRLTRNARIGRADGVVSRQLRVPGI